MCSPTRLLYSIGLLPIAYKSMPYLPVIVIYEKRARRILRSTVYSILLIIDIKESKHRTAHALPFNEKYQYTSVHCTEDDDSRKNRKENPGKESTDTRL